VVLLLYMLAVVVVTETLLAVLVEMVVAVLVE
jgi:hypothetical protein